VTYTPFEAIWREMQAEKALKLAGRYASVKEAFNAFLNPADITLLASVLHPDQRVVRVEKSGSAQMPSVDSLPYYSDREGYSTVRYGTVYYFHPSTLKEGDVVEWDGGRWVVLMNYLKRGSAGSLAYQCLYLLEVQS
jgi:hypothetical protein